MYRSGKYNSFRSLGTKKNNFKICGNKKILHTGNKRKLLTGNKKKILIQYLNFYCDVKNNIFWEEKKKLYLKYYECKKKVVARF